MTKRRIRPWILFFFLLALAVVPAQRAILTWLYPYPYRGLIEAHARRHGLDPLLVAAVVREESGFNPQATSPVGAIGLMQLMPKTAHWLANRQDWPIQDLHDPETNIRLGTAYLRYLLDRTGKLDRALAAYNGGEGNVARWGADEIRFPETKAFVERSLRSYSRYTALYGREDRP